MRVATIVCVAVALLLGAGSSPVGAAPSLGAVDLLATSPDTPPEARTGESGRAPEPPRF